MKLLIADDEKLARLRLQSLVAEIDGDFQVVAEAENGLEALQKWKETQADVLLLDIRMPEMDGLDVAREIVKYSFPISVIFTTAFSEHALQAFDANAVDYLLKPIRKDRLISALKKAQNFNHSKWQGVQSLTDDKVRSHICVHVQGDIHLIAVKDIFYFLADQKYVTVKTKEKEYLLDESLKSLEQEFSALFIRIHRNALASLMHIEDLQKQLDGQLILKFHDLSEPLTVSRRLASTVRSCLKDFKLK